MARPPARPPSEKRPPNPVAKADAARRRKAGAMPPKKGKGARYDRAKEKQAEPDEDA